MPSAAATSANKGHATARQADSVRVCVVHFGGHVELEPRGLRVSVALEARKAGLGKRVTVVTIGERDTCTNEAGLAVSVYAWPSAVFEVGLGSMVRRVQADANSDVQTQLDTLAREIIGLLNERAEGADDLSAAPPLGIGSGEIRPVRSRDPQARSLTAWFGIGGEVTVEDRSVAFVRGGLALAGALSVFDGALDIGLWSSIYPVTTITSSGVESAAESGANVGVFAGYNGRVTGDIDLRARAGMGIDIRSGSLSAPSGWSEYSHVVGMFRAELAARWRFASVLHIEVVASLQVFTARPLHADEPGLASIAPSAVASGGMGLRLGLNL